MKKPTQLDIAQQAGVSRTTVSYVLNPKAEPNIPISQETRARVLQAAQELGYEPDSRAQSLRSGKTHTLGILVPDLENPHYWEIIQGAMQAAQIKGYELLVSSCNHDAQREEESIRSLFRHKIDGLVLLPSFIQLYPQIIEQITRQKLPVVLVGCRDVDIDCVGSNYGPSAKELMQYLHDQGHQSINLILGKENQTFGEDRLFHYFETLNSIGLGFDASRIIRTDASAQDAYLKAYTLLSTAHPPSAIVAANDYIAMSIIRAAADVGLRVPQDLSVASFDDIALASQFVPRLTTVRMEAESVGKTAITFLVNRLENPEQTRQKTRIEAQLIIRESTGRAPKAQKEGRVV